MTTEEFRALQKQSPLERELQSQLDRAGIAFETQYKFSPERKWRSDFFLRHYGILLEVDGGVWVKGESGHNSGSGITRGYERANEAQILGYKILRFEGNAIKSGAAMQTILRAIGIGANKHLKAGHGR